VNWKKYEELREQHEKGGNNGEQLISLLKEKEQYLAQLQELKNKIILLEKQIHDLNEKEKLLTKENQEMKKEILLKMEELTVMFEKEAALKREIEELKNLLNQRKARKSRTDEEKNNQDARVSDASANKNENNDSWLWWLKDF